MSFCASIIANIFLFLSGLELFWGRAAFNGNPNALTCGPALWVRLKYAWLCTTRQVLCVLCVFCCYVCLVCVFLLLCVFLLDCDALLCVLMCACVSASWHVHVFFSSLHHNTF